MTTLDLAAIEADLERQLDRTRRMPTEPMISIRAETLRGLIAAARAGGEPRPREWRCFHCDEVFTDKQEACAHFGVDETCDAACKIASAEDGLVGYIRDLEHQLHQYRVETDPISKSWYAMKSDHQQALIREEQRGYDKGLADGRLLK